MHVIANSTWYNTFHIYFGEKSMDIVKIQSYFPIYIGWSKKLRCRGVFALEDIKKDKIVETCPTIMIPHASEEGRLQRHAAGNLLDNYYYDWDEKYWCLPLGFGMLYNHSYTPNMDYVYDEKNKLIKYVAIQDIQKDDELTINYNGEPDDQTSIDTWFNEYTGKSFV